jgi:hypothetical protein
MQPPDHWLSQYRDAHERVRAVDWLLVPLTVAALTGLLWSLPVPRAFSDSAPVLNWGTLFLMAAVVYYFIISINLAFGLLPFVVIVVVLVDWLDRLPTPLWLLSATGLAICLATELQRTRPEGRPSAARRITFAMMGPLWLLAAAYRRLGIRY